MSVFAAFMGGSYRSQSPISDQETLVNWYLEAAESQGATSPKSMYPTPGVERFAQAISVGGRAMFAGITSNRERCFGVIGNKYVEIDDRGVVTVRGTVATNGNPATISTNGDGGGQNFITSGARGYVHDLGTNVFTEIVDLVADQGGMLYGYFVAFDRDASRIRISDLFDGLTWDPTQFAQRTIGSDPWRGMLVTPYGQILLPGTESGEFWYNAGAFQFPFVPDPSGLFANGVAATYSLQHSGNQNVYVSGSSEGGYQVVAAVGFQPQKISTFAVDLALSRYAKDFGIDDAIGQTYQEEGHQFYLLTLPKANVTLAYDFNGPPADRWANRGTWNTATAAYDYWRPVYHCFAFGKHLMADRQSGIVYRMANDLPLDVNGELIRRLRRAPSLVNENKYLVHAWFELLLDTGLGVIAGQGSVPLVMLRYSDDGGRTWSNELTCSAGRIGEYPQRVYWTRLGQARQRVYEVSVSDPIPWRITAAFIRSTASTEGRAA